MRFYSQNDCGIAEAIIDDEAKSKIKETCQKELKAMFDDGVLTDEPLHFEAEDNQFLTFFNTIDII